ncbi:MAG: hypothetical protein A2W93_13980 [Bacteroidetes bacterium GWF2_43_63]|nr:MAG: hypothetical protein A2W94_00550 [Bacteroidetes bacterium GWE2_42_42]OFY52456.1 MAG: hypothetical protein A2W93_13980 [Bacteroidetes bacterium GWF2_43_63]HBG71363.1 hypothetical protein [Bacteroidales bacterium]HCB60887.1 hypothetical protein [Bacteroidales bacterium]HCY23938.1 hypothetical protein [Bacteroidales bacterium]
MFCLFECIKILKSYLFAFSSQYFEVTVALHFVLPDILPSARSGWQNSIADVESSGRNTPNILVLPLQDKFPAIHLFE